MKPGGEECSVPRTRARTLLFTHSLLFHRFARSPDPPCVTMVTPSSLCGMGDPGRAPEPNHVKRIITISCHVQAWFRVLARVQRAGTMQV